MDNLSEEHLGVGSTRNRDALSQGRQQTTDRMRVPLAIVVVASALLITITGAIGALMKAGIADSTATGSSLVVVGSLLILSGAWSYRRSTQALLAVTSLSMSLCVLVSFLYATHTSLPYLADRAKQVVIGRQPVKVWREHPDFGYSPIPGAVEFHAGADYSVRYTIGENGWRFIPGVSNPAGRITITGCSYTFGMGVEDAECYPAVLARLHMQDFDIRNVSAAGWSTTQALTALREELKREDPPDLFLYGWIGHHKTRNYPTRNWMNFLRSSRDGRVVQVPHFEYEQGELVHKGLWRGPEKPLELAELVSRERSVTLALLSKMDKLCQDNGIDFFVLRLSSFNDVEDDYIFENLPKQIDVIDLRGVSDSYFENDPHPTRQWHQAVANAIAADPEISSSIKAIRRRNAAGQAQ